MKTVILLLFSLLISLHDAVAQTLYPAEKGRKIGFVDENGAMKIPFQYQSGYPFLDGASVICKNGLYGFIFQDGRPEIPAQFEYALPFSQGRGRVYENGKIAMIDMQGQLKGEFVYSYISRLQDGYCAIVRTASERYGLIDLEGKLILDTNYRLIEEFHEGLATVYEWEHLRPEGSERKWHRAEVAVVNTKGEIIVTTGRYTAIGPFSNGLALAKPIGHNEAGGVKLPREVINQDGKVVFYLDLPEDCGYRDRSIKFQFGLLPIVWKDCDEERTYRTKVINIQGNLLFESSKWLHVKFLSENLGIALDTLHQLAFIDRNGKEILDKPGPEGEFFWLEEGGDFILGTLNEKLTFIDGNGQTFSLQALDGRSDFDRLGLDFHKGITRFSKTTDTKNSSITRQGFWIPSTGFHVPAIYEEVIIVNGDAPMVVCVKGNTYKYFNSQGKPIWKNKHTKPNYLNITRMLPGHFYASSTDWDKTYTGMEKPDYLQLMKTNKTKPAFLNPGLNLLVEDAKIKIENKLTGHKLFLANAGSDTLYFDAQDGRLDMVIQAQDEYGNWRDIEYLPSSWCGNSYHNLFLPPGTHWEFDCPIFQGRLETIFRVKLEYKDTAHSKKELIGYSNTYPGSVNPGQFWRQPNSIYGDASDED